MSVADKAITGVSGACQQTPDVNVINDDHVNAVAGSPPRLTSASQRKERHAVTAVVRHSAVRADVVIMYSPLSQPATSANTTAGRVFCSNYIVASPTRVGAWSTSLQLGDRHQRRRQTSHSS